MPADERSAISQADYRPEWFRTIMDALTPDELQRLRDKCRWEGMSMMAVLIDWPSLAPEHLRDTIPGPGEGRMTITLAQLLDEAHQALADAADNLDDVLARLAKARDKAQREAKRGN